MKEHLLSERHNRFDAEIEKAVIGNIINFQEAQFTAIPLLNAHMFFIPEHRIIFNAIQSLIKNSIKVDSISLTSFLKKEGNLESVGGAYGITLLSDFQFIHDIEYQVRLLQQLYIERELVIIAQQTKVDAENNFIDTIEKVSKLQKRIDGINQLFATSNVKTIQEHAIDIIDEAEKAMNGKQIDTIPTGFIDLDKIISGLVKSDLIIVGARAAMGKSSFVLTIAEYLSSIDKKVGFFSLEMSAKQLVMRLISMASGVSSNRIRMGKISVDELNKIKTIRSNIKNNIIIEDKASIGINEFRGRAIAMKNKGVDVIMVDYLQLMKGSNKNNREQDISEISRGLKIVAKELDIPIIALSQLNREADKRTGNKKPQLSDLRESGSIEADSDLVLLLFRPEYYGMLTDSSGNDLTGLAEVIVAKNRSGSLKSATLRFHGETTKFLNIEDEPQNQLNLISSDELEF